MRRTLSKIEMIVVGIIALLLIVVLPMANASRFNRQGAKAPGSKESCLTPSPLASWRLGGAILP